MYMNNLKQKIYNLLSGSGRSTINRQMMRSIMITVIGLLLLLDVVIYRVVFNRILDRTTNSVEQVLRVEASYTSQLLYRYMDDLCILRHIVDFDEPEKSLEDIQKMLMNHGNPYRMYRLTRPDGTSFNSITGRDKKSAKDRTYFKSMLVARDWMCFEGCEYEDVLMEDCYSLSLLVQSPTWQDLGIITVYFPTDELDNNLLKLKLNGSGTCLLVQGSGMVRRFSDGERPVSMHIDDFLDAGFTGIDTVFANSFKRFAESNLSVDIAGSSEFSNETRTPFKVYYVMIPGMSQLALALCIPKYAFYSDFYFILFVMVLLTITIIAALFILARRLTHKLISAPLEKVNRFTNDFADGNLYSKAIDDMESQNEYAYLKENLKKMQHKVYDAISNIRSYSQEISADSVNLTSSMSKVSDGAKIQADTVEKISQSAENIADIIKGNTERSRITSSNSLRISQDIKTVTNASEDTLACIRNVIEKTNIINEITHKTDILAVNAAVAASRAGEHGKTFGVVAEEIRKLSGRCQQASIEINNLSAESLRITATNTQLIEQISPRIQENAQMVAEISDSCTEQLEKSLQIQQAIQQLADITAVNSQSAEQLDLFSGRLSDKIRQLNICIDFFKLDDSKLRKEDILKLINSYTDRLIDLNGRLEKK